MYGGSLRAGGDLRVNLFALIDYDKYRKQLVDRNARKAVQEFSVIEILKFCPVAKKVKVIVIGDE